MSDPEPVDQILRKIKRKWDVDKEGWSVLGNVDKDGNREMFINQAPNSFWLKMRTITARKSMAYGKELRNIDAEIKEKTGRHPNSKEKAINQQEMVNLFGMVVPTKGDVLYTTGVERFSPEKSQEVKEHIEQKESGADMLYRLYLRKKWQREQELRENMYL